MNGSEADSYYCEVCNEQYDIQSLYACYQGHFFCKACFKQEYYKGKEQRCPHLTCNAWIDNAKPNSANRGEPVRISNKMFPQAGLYVEHERHKKYLNLHNFQQSAASLVSLSKRPLHCPHKECNKTIAVSSLDSHFRYEHKHVAFIDTHLEARNGLEFFVDDVKMNEILCVVLINIMNRTDYHPPHATVSSTMLTRSSSLLSAKPVLVVMATRLQLAQHEKTSFEKNDDNEEFCDCVTYPPSEKLFIWIASNIVTKFNYTLAVSTLCNGLRVKYYGPLMTLNEESKTLCMEGKGLILSENHLTGMSENCTKPLILDMLIHSTDEASYTT